MSDPSSYLKLLPSIYSDPQTLARNPFLGQYLNIFEKLMSGLEIPSQPLNGRKGWGQVLNPEVIGELFYSRLSFLFPDDSQFIPPLTAQAKNELAEYFGLPRDQNGDIDTFLVDQWISQLLDFTSSWIDLVLDHDVSLDKRRLVIASIMPLFRKRGTRDGLQQMIDLLIDLTWLNQPLLKIEVKDITKATPWVVGNDSTRLLPVYRPGAALVGGVRTWVFLLEIRILCFESDSHGCGKTCDQACWTAIRETLQKVYALTDSQKPEYSYYEVHFHPTLKVGCAVVGQSTLLGSPHKHYQASEENHG